MKIYLIIALCVVSCSLVSAQQPGAVPPISLADLPPIENAEIETQVGSGEIVADVATIKAIHKIKLSATADGMIEKLNVDEGSVVKKGDAMLVIDSRVANADLEVAKQQLAAAVILEKQTANLDFSQKSYDLARDRYNSNLELYKKGSAGYSETRQMKLEAEKAGFSIDMALDEQKKNQLDRKIADEQLRASKIKLEMHTLKAPFDGEIIERIRDYGEWVRAGEPVFRFIHLNEMKVECYVPLSGVSPNELRNAEMKISVRMSQINQFATEAKVSFVSPEIESGKVKVTARLPNQKDLDGHWLLSDGMTANVVIVLAE